MIFRNNLRNNNIQESVNLELCSFPYGKSYAVTQCTDTYTQLSSAAEMWALKYNIGIHCFDYLTRAGMNDAYNMGRMDFGVYFDSCYANVENNPLDYVNGYIDIIKNIRNGKKPSTLSYGCGKQSYVNTIKPFFLGGRNSFHGNNTNSGMIGYDDSLTHNEIITRASTTRFGYYTPLVGNGYFSGTLQEGIDYVASELTRTKLNNGWYNDFAHWQWLLNSDYLEQHFNNININVDAECYNGNYSELVEYLYIKDSINNINLSENQINISYSNSSGQVDYSLINTPVYYKVNLSNTLFSGQNIKLSDGSRVMSLGNDNYIIQTYLDYNLTEKTLYLQNDNDTDSYINLNTPIVSFNNNVITSDQPIKITLYSKSNTEQEYDVQINERVLAFSSNHNLTTVLSSSRNYYLGYINKDGVSGLLNL